MEEEPLYDEFGNYQGPKLESSDEDTDFESDEESEEMEEDGVIGEGATGEQSTGMELQIRRTGQDIVPYEDKQYYEDNETIFAGAEVRVQEEDTQPLETPILKPIKDKVHELIEKELPKTTFNYEFVGLLMDSPKLIRNVALVGHLHHGKTTFVDMLVKKTHVKNWDMMKELRYLDKRKDEQSRGLSIKATPISLVLQNLKEKSHLLNIIDCPGHVNFSDEMTAGMRLADGVIVCVDAVEGLMMNSERSLVHAVRHGLPVCLLLNKIDRLICELRLLPEDAYLKLAHTIHEVNRVLNEAGSDQVVSPLKGNVMFGSGQYGWAFTLQSFAHMYASYHPELDPNKFAKRLWGDVWLHPDKKFRRQKPGEDVSRTFVQFIMEPIHKIYSHIIGQNPEELRPLLEELDVRLNKTELNMNPKPLIYAIMSRFFFNSTNSLMQMCLDHIPSPVEGNKNVVERFYTGHLLSKVGLGMTRCDPRGPLMINITKMYPRPDASGFDSFGRVFSGTVKVGDKVSVLREGYTTDDNYEDMSVQEVTNIWIYQGRYRKEVNRATAGNWVLIGGIDGGITKVATVTDSTGGHIADIFRPLQFNTIACCKVSVEPLIPAELPKMIDGLRAIDKSYPLCVTKREESGEHVILGTGELYLDCVLKDLREMFSEIEIRVSDPVVAFCETVVDQSQIACFSQTPNHKNKLTMLCEPLEEGIADDIENERVKIEWEPSQIGKFFQTKYKWDLLAARHVWAFGPENNGPNILQDDTLSSEINKDDLKLIRNPVVQGFQWATQGGPLCNEPIRNCRFKLLEAEIDPEPLNRKTIQIIPTTRRVLYSSFLLATPKLMEPMLDVQIQCPADCAPAIRQVCKHRRAVVKQEYPKPGAPFDIFHVQIPAIDHYGFETDIRSHTQGQAFCLSVFDRWELVPGNPMDYNIRFEPLRPASTAQLAHEFMVKTRKRKGLAAEVSIEKYIDDEMLDELAKQTAEFYDED